MTSDLARKKSTSHKLLYTAVCSGISLSYDIKLLRDRDLAVVMRRFPVYHCQCSHRIRLKALPQSRTHREPTGAGSRTPTPPALPLCATHFSVSTSESISLLVLFAAWLLSVKVQFNLQLCLGESLRTVVLPPPFGISGTIGNGVAWAEVPRPSVQAPSALRLRSVAFLLCPCALATR